jgi:cell division protein FtsB
MDCPICKTTGIKTGATTCPKCKSDLEIFQLIDNITENKQGKNIFTILFAILFILASACCVYIYYFYTTAENQKDIIVNEQLTKQSQQIEKLKSNNDALLLKIIDLQKNNENNPAPVPENVKPTPAVKPVSSGKLTSGNARGLYFYEVGKGESLQLIAEKVYGDKGKYTKIMIDNNIEDADQIEAGQKLKIYK